MTVAPVSLSLTLSITAINVKIGSSCILHAIAVLVITVSLYEDEKTTKNVKILPITSVI